MTCQDLNGRQPAELQAELPCPGVLIKTNNFYKLTILGGLVGSLGK